MKWSKKSVSLLIGRIENLKCFAGRTVQSKGNNNKKKRTVKERKEVKMNSPFSLIPRDGEIRK